MMSRRDDPRCPAAPAPPEDVRLVYEDGTEVTVSCVYGGTTPDGHERWVIVDAPPGLIPSGMVIGKLPARSSVVLHVDVDPDDMG